MAELFNVTFASRDVVRLAAFWADALHMQPTEVGPMVARLRSRQEGGPGILILHSDTPAAGPGRVHLDLATATSIPDEVRRLVALGATLADGGSLDELVWRQVNAIRWIVMLDPDGNELCLGGYPADH